MLGRNLDLLSLAIEPYTVYCSSVMDRVFKGGFPWNTMQNFWLGEELMSVLFIFKKKKNKSKVVCFVLKDPSEVIL